MISVSNIYEDENFWRQNIKKGSFVIIVLKADQRTEYLTYGVVKDILTSNEKHTRGIKVRLTTGEVGRVQKILKKPIQEMTFPKEEIKNIQERLLTKDKLVTTRIDKEYNKYQKNETVKTNLNYFFDIINIQSFDNINDHPYFEYLTKKQIELIANKKYQVLTLIKLGKFR